MSSVLPRHCLSELETPSCSMGQGRDIRVHPALLSICHRHSIAALMRCCDETHMPHCWAGPTDCTVVHFPNVACVHCRVSAVSHSHEVVYRGLTLHHPSYSLDTWTPCVGIMAKPSQHATGPGQHGCVHTIQTCTHQNSEHGCKKMKRKNISVIVGLSSISTKTMPLWADLDTKPVSHVAASCLRSSYNPDHLTTLHSKVLGYGV